MKKLKFEEGLAQLEALVAQLEEGGLSLEESIAAYEKGVKLKLSLEKMLEEGRQRVSALTENGDVEALS